MTRRWLWLTLWGVALLFGGATSTGAQGAAPIGLADATYTFGESITFWGALNPGLSVTRVVIQIETAGAASPIIASAIVGDDGLATYQLNLAEQPIPAFTNVRYQFLVTLDSGELLQSDVFSFFYLDNRFAWQSLVGEPFTVYWYTGDETFALGILSVAQRGLAEAKTLLNANPSRPIDIFVYGSVSDYQFARGQLGNLWAGGHTNPDLGLVIVSLPPEPSQQLEIERKIPHEVGHLILYDAAGGAAVPIWLSEGVASNLELNPNPDYAYLLELASEDGGLRPMADLCEAFPRDASGALLAYAQATSFVGYVRELYGAAGVQALVANYANGAGCEFGPQGAPFYQSLTQLDRNWRADKLAENAWVGIVRASRSWLLLIAVILVWPAVFFWVRGRWKRGARS